MSPWTVESDERIRTLSPDLALYISNGPKSDESDTFTVEYEDPDDDTSPPVLRDAAGNESTPAVKSRTGRHVDPAPEQGPYTGRQR